MKTVEIKIVLTDDEVLTLRMMKDAWSPKAGHAYSPEVAKQFALLEKLFNAAQKSEK